MYLELRDISFSFFSKLIWMWFFLLGLFVNDFVFVLHQVTQRLYLLPQMTQITHWTLSFIDFTVQENQTKVEWKKQTLWWCYCRVFGPCVSAWLTAAERRRVCVFFMSWSSPTSAALIFHFCLSSSVTTPSAAHVFRVSSLDVLF